VVPFRFLSYVHYSRNRGKVKADLRKWQKALPFVEKRYLFMEEQQKIYKKQH